MERIKPCTDDLVNNYVCLQLQWQRPWSESIRVIQHSCIPHTECNKCNNGLEQRKIQLEL